MRLSPRYFATENLDPLLRAGLVGCWLGGGSGRTWFDRSGYGNHAAMVNAPAWTLSRDGAVPALSLSGGAYLDVGDRTPLKITGPFSVCARFKISSAGTEQYFYAKCPGGGGSGIFLGIYLGNVIAGANSTFVSSAGVSTTEWQQAVGTFDGTSMRVYLNGVLSGGPSAQAAPADNSASALIGKAGFGFPLTGLVDHVRVYNRALSSAEVALLARPDCSPIIQPAMGFRR